MGDQVWMNPWRALVKGETFKEKEYSNIKKKCEEPEKDVEMGGA